MTSKGYIADTHALVHMISPGAANQLPEFIDLLSTGAVGVCTKSLDEFRDMFTREETSIITDNLAKKFSVRGKTHISVAGIAEEINQTSFNGTHDSKTELYCAAISLSEGLVVVTTSEKYKFYCGIKDVTVVTIDEILS